MCTQVAMWPVSAPSFPKSNISPQNYSGLPLPQRKPQFRGTYTEQECQRQAKWSFLYKKQSFFLGFTAVLFFNYLFPSVMDLCHFPWEVVFFWFTVLVGMRWGAVWTFLSRLPLLHRWGPASWEVYASWVSKDRQWLQGGPVGSVIPCWMNLDQAHVLCISCDHGASGVPGISDGSDPISNRPQKFEVFSSPVFSDHSTWLYFSLGKN